MNKTNVTLMMITVLAVLAISGCNQKPVEQKAPVTTTPSAQNNNQSATDSITIEESKPKDVTGSITVEPSKPTTKVEVTPVNSDESLKEANKALEEANKAVSASKAATETTKKTVTPAE